VAVVVVARSTNIYIVTLKKEGSQSILQCVVALVKRLGGKANTNATRV